MKILVSARVAACALWVHTLRSVLAMLGVAVGVGAVITMVAVGSGAEERVRIQVQSLGVNVIIAWASSANVGGVRLGAATQPTVTEDDAWAIQNDIPLVEAAAPYSRGTVQIVHGNQNWSTALLGVTPEYFPVRDWDLVAGRTIAQDEVDGAAKVALIGLTAAEKLFGDEDPVGRMIRVQSVPFTVVGVLARKGQTTWGQDQDDQVLVPLSTAKRKILGADSVHGRAVGSISIKVREAGKMKQAEQEIRALLRQRHRLQDDQGDDFVLQNLANVLQVQETSSRTLTTLLAAVALVSLVVGGIGIMTVMLVSVTERTREIGLRMAVGARSRDILTQFLVEAVMLAVGGGIIGIGLGVAGSYIVNLALWRTEVSTAATVLAWGFSAAVGIFFGFYPARKAARLNPAEAMRYE